MLKVPQAHSEGWTFKNVGICKDQEKKIKDPSKCEIQYFYNITFQGYPFTKKYNVELIFIKKISCMWYLSPSGAILVIEARGRRFSERATLSSRQKWCQLCFI